MPPFDPHTEDRSELIPHQAVNGKVGGGVEDEQEVHQTESREERSERSVSCPDTLSYLVEQRNQVGGMKCSQLKQSSKHPAKN